jgi:serine/threonine-protein kinase
MQKDPNLRYQNATEMIKDLQMALKRPNEDFVVLALRNDDSPTQKIPTIYQLEMEKNNDRNAPKIGEEPKEEKKKKNKFIEFLSKHKIARVLLILIVLGIIFFAAAFGVMHSIKSSIPKDANVPTLVYEDADKMLTEEEAIEKLKKAGFTNYEIKRESSDTVEAGYVMAQDPSDNITHKVTTKVTITVSSGPEIVTLPNNIVGKQIDDITTELKKLGLPDPEITYETSETAEKGMILSIEPDGAEGEQVVKSTVLSFVVSSGSQYADVEMIKVIGDEEDVAVNKLEAKGIVVEVKTDVDTSKDDGVVLAQSVEEGKVIKENDKVTITVNKLPESHAVTFVIDVASYYPKTENSTDTATDENKTDSNSTSSTPKNVTVELYIGGQSEKNVSVSTSETGYQIVSHEYSGNLDVKVIIAGNTVYTNKINFSQADQIIPIGQ